MNSADYRASVAARMTEAELQAHVILAATTLGWRHYHTHRSDRSPAGFPDLVLVRRGVVVFAELKRQTGRVSPAQREWLADLKATPNPTYVWRPGDWLDGTITHALT